MTDYKKATGSTGSMMIRDTGTAVQFWISSGNSSTFDNDLEWAYTANGSTTAWKSARYEANAGWQQLGSVNVTTTQTVTFKIEDTGTSGFGGPTTFNQSVNRAKVPAAPTQPTTTDVEFNSIKVAWTPNSNGGATITGFQLGYGTSSSAPVTIIDASSPTTVASLAMGTLYYFWVRAKNSAGWSAWSKVASAKTHLGVYVNVAGVWKPAIPYVHSGGVWKQAQASPVQSQILQGGQPPTIGGSIPTDG